MADHQSSRPLPTGLRASLEHAAFRASRSPSGIGAAVTRSGYEQGQHRWDVIASDGSEHHYLLVLGDLGPRPNLSAPTLEEGVEGLAEALPKENRLRALAGLNPLHVDAAGRVTR